jgi:hypothetical protein
MCLRILHTERNHEFAHVKFVVRGLNLEEEKSAEGIYEVNKQNWSTIYYVTM